MFRSSHRTLVLALFTSAFLTTAPAIARPPFKEALVEYFGPHFPKKLNDCRICHVPPKEGEKVDLEEERPHTAFGARVAAVRAELKKAGKKFDINARLDAILEEDSDGDGVPNILEILAGHFPGERDDKPTDAEIVTARQSLPLLAKFRSSYPWRPFEAVKRPAPPVVKNAAWVRNPIDAFIAAEHEERGLKPRPEAPKLVLLRRVYFDLIGLPPTPAEQEAALADESADWFDKVVTRLLNSPQYGERWGRHWMDVWRYSDWAGWAGGNQIRDSQPHIWRWRDWIIEALNDDKGYDRMVLEMLAADELAPGDERAVRATGYLVRNYKMLSREKWLQDTVDHTAQAFLGVTLGCARCHDHMYDPIHQREYYQVRAFFEPHQVRTNPVPGQPDVKKDGLVFAYDAALDAPTYLFIRGDDRTPDKTKPITPGVPEALGGRFPAIEAVKLPQAVYAQEKRPEMIAQALQTSAAAIETARKGQPAARTNAVRAFVAMIVNDPLLAAGRAPLRQLGVDALALGELDVAIAEARHAALQHVLAAEKLEDDGKKSSDEWKQTATAAGQAQRTVAVLEARRQVHAVRVLKPTMLKTAEEALAKAEKAAIAPATTAYTPRAIKTYPPTSTGRRLAFAKWIADRENPLTARVAMNHIWLRHFGQAIVPRVFDFGKNGQRATHPALLDWLAAEFMDRDWSMKAMHRLIVTSSTYRQSSTADAANIAIDRDNVYFWRMGSRRLEAELVRDSIFQVAGQLDRTMGGPDIDHAQGLTLPRRSVYFRHAQEKQMEFLKLFDGAAVTECYQRKDSVLPQQALALANSELTMKHARILARAIVESDDAVFTRRAFQHVLARLPTADETAECVTFLKESVQRAGAKTTAAGESEPALRARENLVQVLLNHHDFVTIR